MKKKTCCLEEEERTRHCCGIPCRLEHKWSQFDMWPHNMGRESQADHIKWISKACFVHRAWKMYVNTAIQQGPWHATKCESSGLSPIYTVTRWQLSAHLGSSELGIDWACDLILSYFRSNQTQAYIFSKDHMIFSSFCRIHLLCVSGNYCVILSRNSFFLRKKNIYASKYLKNNNKFYIS